jgi:RNA polymerase sigma factor (sigma-70 family)
MSVTTLEAPTTAAELLSGITRNDPAAWAEVIHRYGRLLVAKARSFRMQDADVHDAVQMTWVRLRESGHTITRPECLAGWLLTTVTRECWLILGRNRRMLYADDIMSDHADLDVGPEQRAVDEDTAAAVRAAVAELSPEARDLVNALFAPEHLPYAELSRRFGMPIGSIGPTRARHLNKLRSLLTDRGITLAV